VAIQEVRFSQARLLKALKDIFNAVSGAGSTSTTSDSAAEVVRNVRDYEILERLDQVIVELTKLNNQLALMSQNYLDIGEDGNS